MKARQTEFLPDGTFVDAFGAGRPIIFVHGLGCDHTIWSGLAAFSERFRIVRYDLAGHGRTTSYGHIDKLEIFTQQLQTVCKKVTNAAPILVGHSLGGAVAAVYAAESGVAVEKLVLLSTPFDRDASTLAQARSRIAEVRLKGMKKYSDLLFERWFPNDKLCLNLALKPRLQDMFLLNEQKSFLASYEVALDADRILGNAASSIPCPTLLLYGNKDTSAKPSDGRKLAKAIPKALYREIPSAGHMMPIEKQQKVMAEVFRFADQ